jgi:uncharacterized protein (TIGR02118 family)
LNRFTVLGVIYKKDELTYEEFVAHWLDIHAPLFKRIPGVRSYRIIPARVMREIADLIGVEADGFSIVEFDSEEAFREALTTPEWMKSHEDTPKFVRHADIYMIEPHSIVG